MNQLLQHPILEPLGWTLIHFLWQGAMLALLLAIGLTLLRSRPAQMRYTLSCLVLVALALCPLLTFLLLAPHPATAFVGVAGVTLSVHKVAPYLPLLVWSWGIGVIALSTHLFLGWLGVYRLAHKQVAPVPHWLETRFEQIARNMGIRRRVTLLASGLAQAPMAFGFVRQIVLLPAGALVGLSPKALEAILAHELAHIRRHDYLVNFLQTLLEVVLFYHPAIWWVSRQIREERENCCDDLAVALLGDKKLYAHALASLEEWRGQVNQPALAANGGDLLHRIRRILGVAVPRPLSTKAGAVGTGLLLAGTLCLLLCLSAPKAKTAVTRRAVKAVSIPTEPTESQLPPDVPPLKGHPNVTFATPATGHTPFSTKPAPTHKPVRLQTPKAIVRAEADTPTPVKPPTPKAKPEVPVDLVSEVDDDHDPDTAWLKPIVQSAQKAALKNFAKLEVQAQIDKGLDEANRAIQEAHKEIQKAEAEEQSLEAKRAIKVGHEAINLVQKALAGLGKH